MLLIVILAGGRYATSIRQLSDAMTQAGCSRQQIDQAQTLYAIGLSDCATMPDFLDRLIACVTPPDQPAEELIAKVNAAFGTTLSAEEYAKFLAMTAHTEIRVSDYRHPEIKNNLDLVCWAKHAQEDQWGYVYGTFGQVLTADLYRSKSQQYPDAILPYAEHITQNLMGRRVCDCVGLIKAYAWLDPETLEIGYQTNGMPDYGADQLFHAAAESGEIDTIPEIPGLAVWHEGHIGIYIGNDEVIHAAGTMYGVIREEIDKNGWTHWAKIPYIDYIEADTPA